MLRQEPLTLNMKIDSTNHKITQANIDNLCKYLKWKQACSITFIVCLKS